MILSDNSISIVLYGDTFNQKVLDVWIKIALAYNLGAEMILISFSDGGDGEVEQFQSRYANSGIRIVAINSDDCYEVSTVFLEANEYVEAEYVLVSHSNTYPNSDLLERVELSEHTANFFTRKGIVAPFDYSTTKPELQWSILDGGHPELETESFIVPSADFSRVARALNRDISTTGSKIARLLMDFLELEFERNPKAIMFVIQNF